MTAQQLRDLNRQLTTGLRQLEQTDIHTDMVYQQLVDAQQAVNRALRGLESREREKVEN